MPTPTPGRLFFVLLVASLGLFLRPPSTNFIFDEQEALLANPYLTTNMPVLSAFEVDFWGRAPGTTIGSYRPLPNLLWRPLGETLKFHTPWYFLILNHLVHALTATCLAWAARRFFVLNSGRLPPDPFVWGVGFLFVTHGLSTEAVCSVVGLADLLVGMFAALLVVFLWTNLPRNWLFGALEFLVVVGLCFFGLLAKETMVAVLPLVAIMVWVTPSSRRAGLHGWVRLGRVLGASASALIGYVALRNRCFSGKRADFDPLLAEGLGKTWFEPFFAWFGQPVLPEDPLNNPLLGATALERVMTAGGIFLEQFGQGFVPLGLLGDHSFPRQPVLTLGPMGVIGCALFVALLVAGGVTLLRTVRGQVASEAKALFGFGCAFYALSYLPVANIFVLLPTIRADRLLYTPSIGLLFMLSALLAYGLGRWGRVAGGLLVAFLALHGLLGRLHANDYADDLSFWSAASRGPSASAKAHLNLGVMLGARGDNEGRLAHTQKAVELAPQWTMGNLYLADVHCRMGDREAALSLYLAHLGDAANSKALTALSLQCIWDAGAFQESKHRLMDLAAQHPDTWLDYFVYRLQHDGVRNEGIPAEFRSRKYNARAFEAAP